MNEKGNRNNEVKQLITNIANDNVNTSTASVNWMWRLKPSSKNRLMAKRYQNLSKPNESKTENDELMRYKMDIDNLSIIEQDPQLLSKTHCQNKNYLQNLPEFIHLQANTNQIINVDGNNRFDMDNSIQYFEEIGNMIEEKYRINYSENMFFKQQDNHSILPFILIKSKEIHRMCLSDYEIKYSYKSYKLKSKTYSPEAFDYYKIGLINFYQGKYFSAYNNFKNAVKLKESDSNILKWYSFASVILLFCDNNKLNFSKMKFIKVDEMSEVSKDNNEEEGFSFFSCCSSRKNSEIGKTKTIQQIDLLNNDFNNINDVLNSPLSNEDEEKNNTAYTNFINNYKNNIAGIDKVALAKEIIDMLAIVINLSTPKNTKTNQIEGWWIYLLISIFAELHPNQNLFPAKSIYEPKYCIKKIKDIDNYMAYIAYAEYNYIISAQFPIDKVLKQLISKYPTRVESYLRYWQLLVKGKFKNFEVANTIPNIFWKNNLTSHFDGGIYSFYILIAQAKSSYLLGNIFYSVTYLQKEYPCNFLFPTLYYLFGKYSSKSNSKSLKNVSLSSLKEVHRLLYEDLQYSVLYWIGNVYFNTGNYNKCYKTWRIYYSNVDKSFNTTQKKTKRIKIFLNKYDLIYNSLSEFKKNLMLVKKYKSKVTKNCNNNSNTNSQNSKEGVNSTDMNSTNKISSLNKKSKANTNNRSTKLNNLLKKLEPLQYLENNPQVNKTFIYEYYKALSHFYKDRNIPEAMRILMNIINSKKHFMKAYFAMWKILFFMKEFNLLLNFSYFTVKISHSNEVSFSDWVKVYILYSRALMLNNKNDDSVLILINILDVFAHIPMEDSKYLDDIYKQNKISTTNFYVNFDKTLQFYSKYHVYKKNMEIFQINCTTKKTQKLNLNFKDNINDDDIYIITTTANSKRNFNSNENYLLSSNLNQTINIESLHSITDEVNIDSTEKLEEYIEMNIELFEVPTESPFLTIISDPNVFLEIGKICAKSELKRELGLICLQDYIQLLKFTNNYTLSEKKDKKKQKAYFWTAILLIQLKQYKQAKVYVDKIDKFYEFDHNQKKSKILKLFVDFYEEFINLNESISYDFEISKEQLQEI